MRCVAIDPSLARVGVLCREQVQFDLLCEQSIRNVWRKVAWKELVKRFPQVQLCVYRSMYIHDYIYVYVYMEYIYYISYVWRKVAWKELLKRFPQVHERFITYLVAGL